MRLILAWNGDEEFRASGEPVAGSDPTAMRPQGSAAHGKSQAHAAFRVRRNLSAAEELLEHLVFAPPE
jgi:hypothetical protein